MVVCQLCAIFGCTFSMDGCYIRFTVQRYCCCCLLLIYSCIYNTYSIWKWFRGVFPYILKNPITSRCVCKTTDFHIAIQWWWRRRRRQRRRRWRRRHRRRATAFSSFVSFVLTITKFMHDTHTYTYAHTSSTALTYILNMHVPTTESKQFFFISLFLTLTLSRICSHILWFWRIHIIFFSFVAALNIQHYIVSTLIFKVSKQFAHPGTKPYSIFPQPQKTLLPREFHLKNIRQQLMHFLANIID